jgi:hypothetical protein
MRRFFMFRTNPRERSLVMQNRTIIIKFRLNHKEADALNRRVKKSGLSREAYLRHLIRGLVPTDVPPPDYHVLMNELRAACVNLSQIAQKAHILDVADAERYDEAAAALRRSVVEITNAVMLPRAMERKNQ